MNGMTIWYSTIFPAAFAALIVYVGFVAVRTMRHPPAPEVATRLVLRLAMLSIISLGLLIASSQLLARLSLLMAELAPK